MIPSSLLGLARSWVAGAVAGTQFLVRLYRNLGDDRQAALALQAGETCERWIDCLGASDPMAAVLDSLPAVDTEDPQGEAQAWLCLVAANADILVLHSLVAQDSTEWRALRGSRTVAAKSFHRSLQGFRVAFPEEVVEPGILQAIESVAAACADAFARQAHPFTEAEQSSRRQHFHQIIYDALVQETTAANRVGSP